MRPARRSAAAVCGCGLLLAGCGTVRPAPQPYLFAADSGHFATPPAATWPGSPSVYVPAYETPGFAGNNGSSWSHDLTRGAATAAMTVGGIEAAKRLSGGEQAGREVAKLRAVPELAAPAAAAEEKAAGKLLMRGAVVAEEGEGLWVLLRLLPFL
jgi:hypothetical protein